MKIHIGTLLFTIVAFLNFNELNATDNQGSSSATGGQHGGARPGAGRPRGRESRRQDGAIRGEFRNKPYFRKPAVVSGPSWGFIEHMGRNIEVWLDDSRQRVIKADYPGNSCPTGRDYLTKNFLVRLATLSGGLQIVEYVNQDGTLMGVRAPRPTTANVLEPFTTQWFIVFRGKKYRVRMNSENTAVESITLASKNEHEVVQGQRAELIDMAGFKFFVVRGGPLGDVMGAEPFTSSVSPPIS